MRNQRLLTVLLLGLLGLSLGGCRTSYIRRSAEVPGRIGPEEVPGAIAAAEEALLADRPKVALDWMRVAGELEGLPSDQRSKIQRLLEISADRFITEVEGDEKAAEVLAEILELELPRQIAVTGALRGAQLYHERGDEWDASKTIQAIDKRFPQLPSGWFSSNRENAFSTLEYGSIHYPSTERGDEVLMRLAEMYEEDKRWTLAILRHEELTTSYPESELVPYSLARIPHLKLASIESPEYDRKAILESRRDLERWLEDFAGHPATEQVEYDLADALVRLTVNDLGVARFYVRIDSDFGARRHAERALAQARQAGDEALEGDAQAILDGLPPAQELP